MSFSAINLRIGKLWQKLAICAIILSLLASCNSDLDSIDNESSPSGSHNISIVFSKSSSTSGTSSIVNSFHRGLPTDVKMLLFFVAPSRRSFSTNWRGFYIDNTVKCKKINLPTSGSSAAISNAINNLSFQLGEDQSSRIFVFGFIKSFDTNPTEGVFDCDTLSDLSTESAYRTPFSFGKSNTFSTSNTSIKLEIDLFAPRTEGF